MVGNNTRDTANHIFSPYMEVLNLLDFKTLIKDPIHHDPN